MLTHKLTTYDFVGLIRMLVPIIIQRMRPNYSEMLDVILGPRSSLTDADSNDVLNGN